MFRLQKVFRARGKQLEVGNAQSRKANEGANQMGASLKMCQRGLDDVKDFKVTRFLREQFAFLKS